MKKIVSIILLLSLFSIHNTGLKALKNNNSNLSAEKQSFTYLFCGFDDTAYNTDAIILMNYDIVSNRCTLVQIPRDTFYNSGMGQNKLNNIVSANISKGMDADESMMIMADTLSKSLGIKIDGYSAYTLDSIKNIVDAIGGVEIDLPCELIIKDNSGSTLKLVKGKNTLDGESAIAMIRHRSSYALGDLSRMDAQKIFLSAFIKKIKNNLNLNTALKLLLAGKDGAVTNIKFKQIISLAMKNRGRIIDSEIYFANSPGKASISSNGISYFFINKNAFKKLLSDISFDAISEFDEDERFKANDLSLENIYFDDSIDYRIYSDEALGEINFYMK